MSNAITVRRDHYENGTENEHANYHLDVLEAKIYLQKIQKMYPSTKVIIAKEVIPTKKKTHKYVKGMRITFRLRRTNVQTYRQMHMELGRIYLSELLFCAYV